MDIERIERRSLNADEHLFRRDFGNGHLIEGEGLVMGMKTD
ncbi:hypothetical protein [Novosphingobium sp. ST904]